MPYLNLLDPPGQESPSPEPTEGSPGWMLHNFIHLSDLYSCHSHKQRLWVAHSTKEQ